MYRRILIPTDGSTRSDAAIEMGVNLAKSVGAEVMVLHVVPKIPQYAQLDYSGTSYKAFIEELEKFGEQMLLLVKEKFADSGIKLETKMCKGNPSHEICLEAKEGRYDLIVMGSRGLGEVKGLLMGSVSSKVVKHADCPVLIVK